MFGEQLHLSERTRRAEKGVSRTALNSHLDIRWCAAFKVE